jgi:epoxyqueuosine reductase
LNSIRPPNLSKEKIRALLKIEGFDAVGFTAPAALDDVAQDLKTYIEAGHHGNMAWIKERFHHRSHPQNLWPETRTIIVAAANYGPADRDEPLAKLERKSQGNISVYAQGKDYHDLLKKRLKRVGRILHQELGTDLKVFVDTAPVMEKPLAMAAGLGWQGKHTNLVSQEFGSWLFLGAIFLSIELASDEKHQGMCGSCQSCLDICPTKAFPAPHKIDARRCISYLTIELKGHIPEEFRKPIGNRIYGCDDCLSICPWNKFASRTQEIAFHPRIELTAPRLADLASLDEGAFREIFSGSPIKRIGRDRFIRNTLIAIGNSGDKDLIRVVEPHLSAPSPLIRAMAIWALHQLADENHFEAFRKQFEAGENDLSVREEWSRAL